MSQTLRMSHGEAELESALQRADALIGRATPASVVAQQFRSFLQQRTPQGRLLQPTQQPPVDIEFLWCTDTTLDRFEIGEYRLRLHHYEPLLRFLVEVRDAVHRRVPDTEVFVIAQGRADETGPELMNLGLSFSRALEVTLYVRAVLERFGTPVEVTPRGVGERLPLASNQTAAGRQRNRNVLLTACTVRENRPPIGPGTPTTSLAGRRPAQGRLLPGRRSRPV